MPLKQQSIKQGVSFSGCGLHTGNEVNVHLKPAEENTGIQFIRVDLPDRPVIKVEFESIIVDKDIPRCTTIGKYDILIHTVEHFMSTLCGLNIDNLTIEIDNNELPGLDGSGLEYLNKIKQAGIIEQEAEREYIEIKEPIGVCNNGSSIFIAPGEDFKISYTLNYDHPYLGSQFFSSRINIHTFENEIAPCRTFCLEEEAKALREAGLGKGANYENTLVVGKQGVISNKVRYDNEFARHKVLDFIGDLYLLGKPIRGNVFAIKSGHNLNIELLKRIYRQDKQYKDKGFIPDYTFGNQKELDVHQILNILPHRYPFLLVDRVVELEKGKRAVAVKNVTVNDNFFQGHFPTRPIMPGVLMVEALAQTGGILVLTNEIHKDKVALFMAADKIKFRKLVEPGERLILEVEVIRDRDRSALLHGKAKVGGEVVTEAEMLFSFTDASFLD